MESLVLEANGRLVLEERPVPSPSAEEPILLRVAYAGVCGSDIPRGFDGGAYHYPLVMGHEFSAVVEAAPSDSAFHAGDRVAVFPLLPDMSQPINQIGEYAVSTGYDYYGSRRDGAFQDFLTVPESALFRVPDSLPLTAAAMTEPCAVAYHAAARPTVHAGDSAAVIGGGPIGLMVAQWLKARGCSTVIVSEVDEKKREIATSLGLTAIDARGKPAEAIIDATDGGAEIVVEACGLPQTFRQAIASARLFGQVVFLGNIHGSFELPEKEFSSVLRRELTIYGTWNSKVTPRGRDEWTRVLASMEQVVRVLPLISDIVPLKDAAATLEEVHSRKRWFNKVLIELDPSAGPGVQA